MTEPVGRMPGDNSPGCHFGEFFPVRTLLVQVSGGAMVWMVLPYIVTMTGTALLAVTFLL